MENIIIDPKQIAIWADESGKFLFKPEAEESLIKLHDTIEMLTELEEAIKEKIAEAGLTLNPNFKGVKGDKVTCTYRSFGTKYGYDWKQKSDCEPFLKKKEYYTVDSDKVDKYLKEVGELPAGIVENDREPKLSISYGKDEVLDKPYLVE